MSLSEWLLDVGSVGAPALVDPSGALSRKELRAAVSARTQELDALPATVAITGEPDRDFVVSYLAALLSGRRVHMPHVPTVAGGITGLATTGNGDREHRAAVVMYTSGSTSEPSPVPLTGGNLVANGSAIVDALGIRDADRILCTMPFNYSFGLSMLHTALASGGCAVLPGRSASVPDILCAMNIYRATIIGLVPTLARRLVRRVDTARARSLRMVQIAGGRLDVASTRVLADSLDGRASLQVMYGLTEATARVTAFNATRHPAKIGSCGRAIPRVTVHCEGLSGRRLAAGQEGTVVVGGPGVCPAYARSDGLLETGDYGVIDTDGFLWIRGRIGAFAKVGDTRVSLAAVEDLLHAQPGVLHAVAVAVPDPVYTERVAALVTPDGRAIDMAQLCDAARNNLPRMLATVHIDLVDDLAMTRNGKVDRLAAHALATTLQKERNES
jgi:long-chain acyl-CoA synthetase